MRLSMSAIYEHLSKKFTVLFMNKLNDENQRYDFTELCLSTSEVEHFEEGKLYLLHGCALTESAVLSNHNGFICVGSPSFSCTFCRCPLLVLQSDISIAEVHADIITFFYQMQNYELTLQNLINKQASLEEFLDATYPFLKGNCITITNLDGKLLAGYFAPDELSYDSAEHSNCNEKSLRETPLPWISNNYDFINKPMIPGMVYSEVCRTSRYNYEVMIIAAFVDKKKYATITISNNAHPLLATEQLLLETLCRSVEKVLSDICIIDSNTDIYRIRFLLNDILSGNVFSRDYCNEKLQKNGILPGSPFICVCVRPINEDVQGVLLSAIRSQVGEYIHNTFVLSKNNDIVLFINMKSINDISHLPDKLNLLFNQSRYKVGMSHTFYNIEEAKYYYEQAHIAIEYAIKGKTANYLISFDHCVIKYIFSISSESLPRLYLCHYGVRNLYNYDMKNHTQYMETLQTYFSNQENATKAASVLYIHRSTLLYRINQIKTIMECDWENYHEKLYIMLSLEMIKVEN
jgi:hypothetical protein